MKALATCLAHELEPVPEQRRWLIEELWAEEAVGIVGGQPKCCKSILALELAVAVASGTPCLGRFPTPHPGPVLLFAAEDAAHVVRERLEGITTAAGVSFETLAIHIITVPTLRIDLEDDRLRLRETVSAIAPRLLVLDPFVRLHRADENVCSEVAPLLAYLRELQRGFHTAVLLVHHSKKGSHARPGQALRGSSELHAWGDSNLYLHRQGDRLGLSIEHRAAPSLPPLALELHTNQDALALRVLEEPPPQPRASPRRRVIEVLCQADQPMTRRALRAACRMRATTVGKTLAELIAIGRVREDSSGYRLTRSTT